MRAIRLSGLLLGLVVGFLVGVASSPVVGVAVTGLLALGGSALTVGAEKEELLASRWDKFNKYVIYFIFAFVLAGGGGYWLRSTLPTPAEALVTELKKLNADDATIASAVAAAVGNVDSPEAFLATGFLYGDQGEVGPKQSPAVVDPDVQLFCARLRSTPWSEELIAELGGSAVLPLKDAADLAGFAAEPNREAAQAKIARMLCGSTS